MSNSKKHRKSYDLVHAINNSPAPERRIRQDSPVQNGNFIQNPNSTPSGQRYDRLLDSSPQVGDDYRVGYDRQLTLVRKFKPGQSHSKSKRVGKLANAIFNVANAALGSGVLAFPFAYKQAGMGLAIIMTLLGAVTLTYTLTVIMREARLTGATSYQELILQSLGKKAYLILLFALIVYCFFTLVNYLLVLQDQTLLFIQGIDPTLSGIFLEPKFLLFLAWLLVLPLCLMPTVDMLGPFSLVGVVAVLYAVVMICYYGATHSGPFCDDGKSASEAACTAAGGDWKQVEIITFKSSPTLIQSIPIIMFAMMCHMTAVPACADLGEYFPSSKREGVTRFRTLVLVGFTVMVLCTVLYVPTGVFGYMLFGKMAHSDILVNFGEHTKDAPFVDDTLDVKIARICMVLTTGTGYPVLNYVARLALQDVAPGLFGKARTYSFKKTVPLTIVFTGASVAAAILIKALNLNIGFCMTLIGSTSATLIQFIFPGLMLNKAGKTCRGYAMVVLGSLIAAAGVFIAIADMICAGGSPSPAPTSAPTPTPPPDLLSVGTPAPAPPSSFCKAMGLAGGVS